MDFGLNNKLLWFRNILELKWLEFYVKFEVYLKNNWVLEYEGVEILIYLVDLILYMIY